MSYFLQRKQIKVVNILKRSNFVLNKVHYSKLCIEEILLSNPILKYNSDGKYICNLNFEIHFKNPFKLFHGI